MDLSRVSPSHHASLIRRSDAATRGGAVKVRMIVVLLLIGVFVVAALLSFRVDTEPPAVLLKKMKGTFDKGEELRLKGDTKQATSNFNQTESYARRVLAKDPKSSSALFYSGQSLLRLGRDTEALDDFLQVKDDSSIEAAACHLSAGQLLFDKKSQFREAEKHFRRSIELQPYDPSGYELLSIVMRLGTRDWELIPLELKAIELKRMTVRILVNLARNQQLPPDINQILQGTRLNPDDPNVLLGRANLERVQKHFPEAEALLHQAIAAAPEIVEPHVRLGWVYFEEGQDAKFLKWHADAKQTLVDHPLFWSLRGAYAEKVGQTEVAARCYWEALKRDPNLSDGNYQLGQLLLAMERKDDAQPFLDRALKLVHYIEITNKNVIRAIELGGKGDLDLATQAAKASDELGNAWEAYGWIQTTVELDPSNKAIEQDRARLEAAAEHLPPVRTIPQFNPANKIDLSKLPLPDWKAVPSQSVGPKAVPVASRVAFEERTAKAGVAFQFFDGSDPDVKALNKMYQINGGGIGVVDYDRDGWPDLYFTQGSKDPQDREQTEHLDRLFRNTADGRFVDVTAASGIVENSFSQGVSVGDVDNDGFPDIFVGNFGANRLFLNNGDGTFSDVTADSDEPVTQWTSSCLVADINGDALPDLFALGFLGGDALNRVCSDREKRLDACVALEFPASKNRLWLNRGNGKFEDVSDPSGIDPFANKGTSLIAANLDGSRKLCLYIGNEGKPNFYFQNLATKLGDAPKFSEQGLMTGLALAGDGMPRFTRGLAAGDFNGDGLLDFHGTSYTEESDTLSLQQHGGWFRDASRASGLLNPTFMVQGQGTQVIDGDLDGRLDLITANGNVDNPKNDYLMYEMSPTYFENNGKAEFLPVSAETLGPYFKGKYLGRSVVRLDWDRDGREDLVIGNVRSPAALLANTTPKAGHHLTVRLVSTGSARDSIGTSVDVLAGGKTLVRQLTAGDGFQASNERALVFGLGPNTSVESVTIHWMSGKEQRIPATSVDKEILVVEGRSEPVTLSAR